jgi:uncharacterized membrane protein YhiD involved in acid resistance
VSELLRVIRSADGSIGSPTLESTLLCLLLAFVLAQLIAWLYVWTHKGLSYSRTFTQSLVLITMIVSMVMLVIGNNIFTAFGLLGALAIIRFRNVLKDTRDTAFVFIALVVGMAIGSQRYQIAIVGTMALIAVSAYMHVTAFGSRGHFDGYLTFLRASDESEPADLPLVLRRFCRSIKRISSRHGSLDGVTEYVFQVRLRDRRRSDELVAELRGLPSVQDASLVIRDELAEL